MVQNLVKKYGHLVAVDDVSLSIHEGEIFGITGPNGVPMDLGRVLIASPKALAAWEDLTPLAGNEWICWVLWPKKAETRSEHIQRMRSELLEGKRRPCCWLGCTHRKDKELSASVRWVLSRRSKASA
jgi:hypothetical protein